MEICRQLKLRTPSPPKISRPCNGRAQPLKDHGGKLASPLGLLIHAVHLRTVTFLLKLAPTSQYCVTTLPVSTQKTDALPAILSSRTARNFVLVHYRRQRTAVDESMSGTKGAKTVQMSKMQEGACFLNG
jgi:hypothetical protein